MSKETTPRGKTYYVARDEQNAQIVIVQTNKTRWDVAKPEITRKILRGFQLPALKQENLR